QRAAVLGEFELDWWLSSLLPVVDRFVDATAGRIDLAFWSSLYKEERASGGPHVSGWINALFPYLNRRGGMARNPYVDGWMKAPGPGGRRGGLTSPDLPSGLSSAPFVWNYLGKEIPMELLAGFVGVSQDRETLGLRPAIGWAVCTGEEREKMR